MEDSNAKKYFKFPLCLLSYNPPRLTDPEEIIRWRLQHIMGYCVLTVGESLADHGLLSRSYGVEDIDDPHSEQIHHEYADEAEEELMGIGASALDMTCSSWQQTRVRGKEAERFVNDYHDLHGTDYSPKVRTDIFWDAVNGRIEYRRFTTFCAALTMIGNKPWAQLTRSVVRHRELGHIKPDTWKAEGDRKDGLKPFTDDQIRYRLNQLEAAGLIVRATLSPRRVIASNKLSYDELLATAIKKRKAQKKVAARRESERELMKNLSPL